ncbi:ABC transporter ATP-binding protein [Micromonospora globbae]|uniref:ABC transporter ATP-binding protein n=1 Tax=Micromonospora globbae TaxID=1894969 RepID=A0A420EER2_9ACTN|nr:ABC transporter ATP-binding protein [Micromonospora globbae]RKF19154.1 ABC transporter ATP-binding protein [Micromonospora globbae]
MTVPVLPQGSSVVRLSGAGVTYPGPPPVPALRNCDLSVSRGEYVTIIGPSGSGKSTLLNILGLLDRPTEGRYILDGTDTGGLKDRDRAALRAHKIGFVFQAFHLLSHRTAEENVMLAALYRGESTAKRRAAARDALIRVGLDHRSKALPSQLSGGERQRVAIARAIAARPTLLLCDEPTGNLDSATAEDVLNLVDDLHREGLTVLMITHDPRVALRGMRTIAIHDGIVTEVQR